DAPRCRRSSCEDGRGDAHGRRTSTSQPWLLTSLSGLATHDLARVADTLALVRLRPADLADARSCLADSLLVDATHGELVGALDRQGDARRRVDQDRVREAQGELDRAALLLHAVTGADDLEPLGVTLGDADDVVVD